MSDPNVPTAAPTKELAKPSESMSGEDLLRATRPKHLGEGIGSGLAAIGGGIVAGVAGLVVAPVAGAKKGGVVGFAGGLAAGVVGVVVLPVAGIAGGVVQIGRGVVNTPEAIHGKYTGKVWNDETKEWEAAKELPTTAIQVYKAPAGGGGGKHDIGAEDLYAILGVDKSASPEQIKKKYYLLARKYHPDKNPDEESKEMFQAVGRAFQILGNPETRSKYDRGELDASGQDVMDAGVLFSMIFGSDKFQSLVGELMAVTMAKHGDAPPPKSELRKVQEDRVMRLAGILALTLDAYDPKDPEAFKKARTEQAQMLAEEPFGETLLAIIGEVYIREAARNQANFLKAGLLRWERKKADMNAGMAQVKSAFAIAKQAQKAQEIAEEIQAKVAANPDNEEIVLESIQRKEELEKETMLLMLQFMWAVNDVDIRETLKNVVALVLREDKNEPDRCKNRATALLEMGNIFTDASAPAEVRSKSEEFQKALQRMEDAQRGAAPS